MLLHYRALVTEAMWVAILGITGTLLGVTFTQVWAGQQEKARARRGMETRFHDHRRQVYTQFLSHCLKIRENTRWLVQHWGLPAEYIEANRPDDPEEWLKTGRDLLASIDLVAGPEVQGQATGMFAVALSGGLILSGPDPRRGREEVEERGKAAERIFQDAYGQCLKAMRADLGMPEVSRTYAF